MKDKWRTAAHAFTGGHSTYSESRRGSLTSAVNSEDALSHVPSMASRRSRRGRQRQSVGENLRKQGTFKKRYEEDVGKYKQLAAKLKEQEDNINTLTSTIDNSVAAHESLMAEMKNKIHVLKQNIENLRETIDLKEEVIKDNHDQIREWRGLAFNDEVRRAFNFILRTRNDDIYGVRPEDVFDQETMEKFYASKRVIKKNRRIGLEKRQASKFACSVGGMVVPVLVALSLQMKEEAKFRMAVLRSVGIKTGEGTGGKWLAQVAQKVPETEEDQEKPAPPPTPPPEPIHCNGRWARYLASHNDITVRKQPQLSTVQVMLKDYRAALTSLSIEEKENETAKERKQRIANKSNKQFQLERTRPESPMPDLFLWKHLPENTTNLVVPKW